MDKLTNRSSHLFPDSSDEKQIMITSLYRLLSTVRYHDHYLLTEDFPSYMDALKLVDEAYLDQSTWLKKSIITCAKMGKFSSDRAILDYADEYWSIEPLKVE
jgi:glycogen phosphorylase